MAFKRSLISSQSPLKWPLMHGGIPIPRHATATGCLTPINGRISAHLAAPRPFYNSTEQRPLQATDALHADEHAIKKAALQARPHTIQFQSNLLSNQPLRKSKQNPSKCTFRFFGHFTTSRRNSLKHRGFRPLTAHSTLHVSFYRPYYVFISRLAHPIVQFMLPFADDIPVKESLVWGRCESKYRAKGKDAFRRRPKTEHRH